MSERKIEVIIPTFNDTERLKECIRALEKQDFPLDEFLVLVVNNNPSNNISLPEYKCSVQILNQKKPGSYAARNTALLISNSEIVAFTDSDCIPHFQWLSSAYKQYQTEPETDMIGGNVRLFFQSQDLTDAELYEKIIAFRQESNIKNLNFAVTANLFVRKKVFKSIGFFDESLQSGGDYEFCQKAFKSGFSLKYSDESLVLHPARASVEELKRKAIRVTKGQIGFRKQNQKSFIYLLGKSFLELRPPLRLMTILLQNNELMLLQKLRVLKVDYQLRIARAQTYLSYKRGA